MSKQFEERLQGLQRAHRALLEEKNHPQPLGNGIFERYHHPVLTAAHTPLWWRYDLNPATNPFLLERFGINAVFNAGALKLQGRYLLVARVEGVDRKSFFAVAESPNGVDGFRFWDRPPALPHHCGGQKRAGLRPPENPVGLAAPGPWGPELCRRAISWPRRGRKGWGM